MAPFKMVVLGIVGAIALGFFLHYLVGFSLLRSVVVVVLALGSLALLFLRSGARDAPAVE
jgi:uncharacterized membrane protein YeaQ/YmgE (transglycosylase-associated protein family)